MTRAALCALLLLAGCMTLPPLPRPEVPVPPQWRSPAVDSEALADQPWTTLFDDVLLEDLIREALQYNSDLRIAADRILQARAQYGIQRSFQFPTISAEAAYTRQRAPGASPTTNSTSETASIGLALPSWEIDFWGRLQSLSEAARSEYLATEQAWRQIYITLIGDVATAYIEVVGLDDQLRIAYRTAESRDKSLSIVWSRNRGGVASKLDVRQAEGLVADARATIADLERQRSQAENALSVLIGRNPQEIPRTAQPLTKLMERELPAGLPSELLERRPDLIAAEQRLRAANLNVDAARKAFLPTISLTAFIGFVSPELRNLIDGNRFGWSAAPAISLPIFTAGRLQAGVDVAEATQRIAIESYRQTARNAFRDVDDALVAYWRYREQREQLQLAVTAGRERLRLTNLRYINGISSYFEVLDAERLLFENELAYAQATRATYTAVVQLYRALGGGWKEAIAPDEVGAK